MSFRQLLCEDRVRRDGLGCDDEDSADALGAQSLHRIQDGAAVEGQEADDADEIAGSMGCALEPEERRRRAVQGGVEAHDSERLRLARGQRSRDGVRTIVELLHRVQYALDRVIPDMVTPVDDARKGLMRTPASLASSAITGAFRGKRPLPPVSVTTDLCPLGMEPPRLDHTLR